MHSTTKTAQTLKDPHANLHIPLKLYRSQQARRGSDIMLVCVTRATGSSTRHVILSHLARLVFSSSSKQGMNTPKCGDFDSGSYRRYVGFGRLPLLRSLFRAE